MKPLTLAGTAMLGMALCLAASLPAQEVDHSQMHHPQQDSAQADQGTCRTWRGAAHTGSRAHRCGPVGRNAVRYVPRGQR